jgi:hypothetical protein
MISALAMVAAPPTTSMVMVGKVLSTGQSPGQYPPLLPQAAVEKKTPVSTANCQRRYIPEN